MVKRAIWTAMGLVMALAGVAYAEGPAGVWKVSMDYQGNPIEGVLTITEGDAGALAGTWEGRMGKQDLQDVKFDAGKLTFIRKVDRQGQQFDLAFTGTIEGDKINGAFDSPMGALTVAGAREATAAPTAADAGAKPGIAGTWDVISKSQLGELKRTLKVKDDLTGTYTTEDQEYPLNNLKMDGNNVTFDVKVTLQGQELALAFAGTVDADKLTGQFTSDAGNAEVTGTKQPAGPKGDPEVIAAVQAGMDALKAADIDKLMTGYADNFTSDQGMDKAAFATFLADAKSQGFLDGLEASLENLVATVDGDKAKAQGIELEGSFGMLTLGFDLEKRDGKWVITYQSQQ